MGENRRTMENCYVFALWGTDAASVLVHVIHGEHPAAMQYGNNSASGLFFHSIFGAFFGRNRNTDTIHLERDQRHKHNDGLAIDGSHTVNMNVGDATLFAPHRSNKTIIVHRNQQQQTCADNMILATLNHQMFVSLAGQLRIIIHAIYIQFPSTIVCWLFHYAIGTTTIRLLLATNS